MIGQRCPSAPRHTAPDLTALDSASPKGPTGTRPSRDWPDARPRESEPALICAPGRSWVRRAVRLVMEPPVAEARARPRRCIARARPRRSGRRRASRPRRAPRSRSSSAPPARPRRGTGPTRTRSTPRRSSTPRTSSGSTAPTRPGARVTAAVNGASIVVYLGHGNGWPSPYTFDPLFSTKDGFGLNKDLNHDGKRTNSELKYYGEPKIRTLTPGAERRRAAVQPVLRLGQLGARRATTRASRRRSSGSTTTRPRSCERAPPP